MKQLKSEILVRILKKNTLSVVDVGARGGIGSFRFLEPYIEAYGFEAEKEEARRLNEDEALKKRFSKIHIEPKAAWSKESEMDLYVCRYPPNSSLLKPNNLYAKKMGLGDSFDVTNTERVSCTRVETVLKAMGVEKVDYIKVDAQGGDLEVLRGVGRYLKYAAVVRLEQIVGPLYQDAPSFGEVDLFMQSHDFRLRAIESAFPKSVRRRAVCSPVTFDRGEIVWCDLVYVKAWDEKEALLEGWRLEDYVKSALLYWLENFHSLAIDVLSEGKKEGEVPRDVADALTMIITRQTVARRVKKRVSHIIRSIRGES